MTAVNQNFARKYKIPIDLIGFAFEITEFELPNEVSEKPEDGAYIRTRFKFKICFLSVAKRPYLLKSNKNIFYIKGLKYVSSWGLLFHLTPISW